MLSEFSEAQEMLKDKISELHIMYVITFVNQTHCLHGNKLENNGWAEQWDVVGVIFYKHCALVMFFGGGIF